MNISTLVKKKDHACDRDAFTCEMCSKTRQKRKHQNKKRIRQSKHTKIVDGEFKVKKETYPLPIPIFEGKPFTVHDTITERYKEENNH